MPPGRVLGSHSSATTAPDALTTFGAVDFSSSSPDGGVDTGEGTVSAERHHLPSAVVLSRLTQPLQYGLNDEAGTLTFG